MMSAKRYSEEFKIEAVKQVTERGYKVSDVCRRLGITSGSLYKWIKLYGDPGSQHQHITEQQDELRQLRAELRRVTEERDILKKAAAFFAKESEESIASSGLTRRSSGSGSCAAC